MTFTVRVVEECSVPEVAFTLTEKLVGAISAAVCPPLVPLLLAAPQAVKNKVRLKRRPIPASERRRLRSTGPMTSMAANPRPGKEIAQSNCGCECVLFCACSELVIVRVVAEPADSVAGINLQVMPAGKFEQDSETCVLPVDPAILILVLTDPPR